MRKIRHKRFKKGITLIELMITAAILITALVALLNIHSYSLSLQENSQNFYLALNAAQSTMEEIRNHNFLTIIADYNGLIFNIAGLDGRGRVEASYVSGSNNELIQLRVVICWREKAGRIIGEDTNLNGVLDVGEDRDGNGHLDSPCRLEGAIVKRW